MLAELLDRDAEGARGITEAAGDLGGGEAVDALGAARKPDSQPGPPWVKLEG
jgi:hypothetical protein